MAKFNNFLVRLLLVTMTLAAAAAAYVEVEKISPDAGGPAFPPENNEILAPAPPPEEQKFLKACVKHFTRQCGREVFVNIVDDIGPVSKNCCNALVAAGEACHIHMVRALFQLPPFKPKASSGIPKSKQIWNKCAVIVSEESPSASPIPFET